MSYPSGVTVDFGNELTPTQVKDEPAVNWPADPNAFYTLCMTGNNTYTKRQIKRKLINFVVRKKPYLIFKMSTFLKVSTNIMINYFNQLLLNNLCLRS